MGGFLSRLLLTCDQTTPVYLDGERHPIDSLVMAIRQGSDNACITACSGTSRIAGWE